MPESSVGEASDEEESEGLSDNGDASWNSAELMSDTSE